MDPVFGPLLTLTAAAVGPLLLYKLVNQEQKARDKIRLSIELSKSYDEEFFSRCRREAFPFIYAWYKQVSLRPALAERLASDDVEDLVNVQVNLGLVSPPAEEFTDSGLTEGQIIRDAHRAFHKIIGYVCQLNESIEQKLVDVRLLRPVLKKLAYHAGFVREVLLQIINAGIDHDGEYESYLLQLENVLGCARPVRKRIKLSGRGKLSKAKEGLPSELAVVRMETSSETERA